jgi:murein L,D-transpeptidase YcbB/YkuD
MKPLFFFALLGLLAANAAAGDSQILRQKLDQLRQGTAATAAITRIDDGPALHRGAGGKRVAQLRQRLIELGSSLTDKGDFDTDVAQAVKAFQEASGLAADGIVDKQTRFNLNLSNADRVAILQSQLEAVEAIEKAEGDNAYLIVNIPAFLLHLHQEGERVLESRVIVGRVDRPTPLMRAEVVGIKYNPPWVPPPTIIKEDIFRNGRVDPKYLADHYLLLLDKRGRAVSVNGLSMKDVFRNGYRFYQPPGNKNALGRLKFELDNTPSVYLHDTNQQSLFKRENRAFSSGCVRVEKYLELAARLTGAAPEEIEQTLRNKKTATEPIDSVPVYFVYWLADVVDGEVVFFHDVYRREAPPN